jgi:hypothetical protein
MSRDSEADVVMTGAGVAGLGLVRADQCVGRCSIRTSHVSRATVLINVLNNFIIHVHPLVITMSKYNLQRAISTHLPLS